MPAPAITRRTPARVTAPLQLPGFAPAPAEPAVASSWGIPEPAARQQIAEGYRTRGYAVVHVPGTVPAEADLTALADALGLGPAFSPPQYRGSTHTQGAVSRLTATADPAHPFQNRAGQRFHCDATLQHLGQVATTVMICVRPGRSGGQTQLFNAVQAFAELQAVDPEAAAQLTHPGALRRTSTFVDGLSTAGPAFGRDPSGDLITRYSLTATDSYHPTAPGRQKHLDRALAALADAADDGSRHRTTFTLAAGQALVLANDKLCHGRTPFTDNSAAPRLLLRALFTTRPTV
ncbi:TauD/TfdA family dioxygenase [Streptomyces sp. CBMA123]|uniref:TauD/TfdA family dioxygenase n=1 Tax=Streptomyces sp. CBMA123 TaxID=1896313 RepID=UPI001DD750A8|nr:TauD/TfdA family dioxygenase [Streptomyces sp. CBMA123]MBD0692477.1 taurine catabolism dioxygenase TauD [Streptomyces sp. CBMA123]